MHAFRNMKPPDTMERIVILSETDVTTIRTTVTYHLLSATATQRTSIAEIDSRS